MRFDQFWECLRGGGKTTEGDKYGIIKDDSKEKLHIISPGNANKRYYITYSKTEEYFELLTSGKIEPNLFRISRSAYFYNVYREVLTKSRSAPSMK